MEQLPKCPWCNTAKHVAALGCHRLYCGKCKREFEDVNDGDIGYGRPSKRMEREERKKTHVKRR